MASTEKAMRDATEIAAGSRQATAIVRHLVEVHAGLTRARDVDELMAALVGALASTGPRSIDFSQVHADPDGPPREIEVIRVWQDGRVAVDHPMYGRRFPFAGSPFGEAVLKAPREALYIEDLAADARAAAELADLPRNIGAVAVLPLYSERHAAWQGVIVVQWAGPHAIEALERQLHALVIQAAAEALASERARGHNESLLAQIQRALQDSQQQQRLLSVLFEHLPLGVAVLRGDEAVHELTNPAAREAMGYDPRAEAASVTGMHVYRPGADAPLIVSELPPARVLRDGVTVRDELEFRRPDAARRIFDVIATELTDRDDPVRRVVLLFHDITAMRAAERERIAARDELLHLQAQALAERSTPLIPVREDLLVLPLIGTIDADRGRQVIEALTQLGGRSQVRAAILDLTGVRALDATAASNIPAAVACAGSTRWSRGSNRPPPRRWSAKASTSPVSRCARRCRTRSSGTPRDAAPGAGRAMAAARRGVSPARDPRSRTSVGERVGVDSVEGPAVEPTASEGSPHSSMLR
jgi:PAS domain-containing protein